MTSNIPDPFLSDRTVRYGRALMIWGSLALIFLYMPGIDLLTGFKPFGLSFTKENGGWVWLTVFLLIFYNFVFFAQGALTDRRITLVHYADERAAQYLKDYPPDSDSTFPMDPHEVFEARSAQRNKLASSYKIRALLEVIPTVTFGGTAIVAILSKLIFSDFFPLTFWPALKAVFSA